MNKIERYKELLNSLEEFSDILDGNSDIDCRYKVNVAVKFLEISEKFGIDFGKPDHHVWSNFRVNEYTRVFVWGENSQISWSDDQRQPEAGEHVYVISFPTGPYIFGEHYPAELFKEFFLELKEYGPKYLDTNNKCLYFSTENAKAIHKDFPEILKKYRNRVKDDYKRIRKEELMNELKKLDGDV